MQTVSLGNEIKKELASRMLTDSQNPRKPGKQERWAVGVVRLSEDPDLPINYSRLPTTL